MFKEVLKSLKTKKGKYNIKLIKITKEEWEKLPKEKVPFSHYPRIITWIRNQENL
jgi:hypothetical protein